jgi:sigma-B regulation protein RsbU (phosphoserine phosphatase)
MQSHKPTAVSPTPAHHELKCLEVWGGSNQAEHTASVPGLDISVRSKPVEGERGGDLYLISSCSSGWVSRMLIADVSGHGPVVSELSAKLRKAMHRSISTVDQSKFARLLNESFEEFASGGKFATALLMSYYAPSGHLVMVNAGHPPPLILRRHEHAWKPLDSESSEAITQTTREVRVGLMNLPLGVIGSTEYEQIAFKLEPGDRVCAYTDAYIENTDSSGSQLGVDGLAETLSRIPQNTAVNELSSKLILELQKQSITPAEDDHTLLFFEKNANQHPKVSVPIVKNWLKDNFGLGHSDTVPTVS